MRATFTFNLPDEQEEYTDSLNGSKYISVLMEVLDILRKMRKYQDVETLPIEEIERLIYAEINSRDLGGLF